MVPYLVICQIGIGLLVVITAVSGFSALFIHFSIGLGIIIGGSTLIGKTHCRQNTFVYATILKYSVR
jgi:hypothetical protein